MRTYKEVKRKVEDTVRCDICDYNCTKNQYSSEYATLEASWGYGSQKDGIKYDVQLCESCFDNILNHIRKQRKKILGCFIYPYSNDPLDGQCYNIAGDNG